MSLYVCRCVRLAAAVWATVVMCAMPASAQPISAARTTGERYNVEAAFALWDAEPTLTISSESLGIPGDNVDLGSDLGIEKKRLSELRVVLRPATKHKFRFHYMPIKYEVEATVQREFVFNGQRYNIGLPVQTTADFTTYRFGYEYDFFYRDVGYVGFLVDLKYTNASVELDSPIGREFTDQVAPIPGIGVAGRGYLVPNLSVTGEMTFFKIPGNLSDEFGGRYLDFDIYGTFNFSRNVGAQLGIRRVDVEYFHDLDLGDLTFSGWYMAGVVRF